MNLSLEEAVRRAQVDGGRLFLEGPTGERTEVEVPEPSDDGDWGPPYLDPPFPAPPVTGARVPPENIRVGGLTPFHPIVIDDSDLAPE